MEREQKVPVPDDTGCVPFDVFKKSLGEAAKRYSDEEIEQIRFLFDRVADMVFDSWLRKRNADIVLDETGFTS